MCYQRFGRMTANFAGITDWASFCKSLSYMIVDLLVV